MSEYWYFACLDHAPPMRSAGEFTQHTEDGHFWAGVGLAGQRPLADDEWPAWDGSAAGHFRKNAHTFLTAHPHCRLALVNEYDEWRPLDTTEQEMGAARIAAAEKHLAELRATYNTPENTA